MAALPNLAALSLSGADVDADRKSCDVGVVLREGPGNEVVKKDKKAAAQRSGATQNLRSAKASRRRELNEEELKYLGRGAIKNFLTDKAKEFAKIPMDDLRDAEDEDLDTKEFPDSEEDPANQRPFHGSSVGRAETGFGAFQLHLIEPCNLVRRPMRDRPEERKFWMGLVNHSLVGQLMNTPRDTGTTTQHHKYVHNRTQSDSAFWHMLVLEMGLVTQTHERIRFNRYHALGGDRYSPPMRNPFRTGATKLLDKLQYLLEGSLPINKTVAWLEHELCPIIESKNEILMIANSTGNQKDLISSGPHSWTYDTETAKEVLFAKAREDMRAQYDYDGIVAEPPPPSWAEQMEYAHHQLEPLVVFHLNRPSPKDTGPVALALREAEKQLLKQFNLEEGGIGVSAYKNDIESPDALLGTRTDDDASAHMEKPILLFAVGDGGAGPYDTAVRDGQNVLDNNTFPMAPAMTCLGQAKPVRLLLVPTDRLLQQARMQRRAARTAFEKKIDEVEVWYRGAGRDSPSYDSSDRLLPYDLRGRDAMFPEDGDPYFDWFNDQPSKVLEKAKTLTRGLVEASRAYGAQIAIVRRAYRSLAMGHSTCCDYAAVYEVNISKNSYNTQPSPITATDKGKPVAKPIQKIKVAHGTDTDAAERDTIRDVQREQLRMLTDVQRSQEIIYDHPSHYSVSLLTNRENRTAGRQAVATLTAAFLGEGARRWTDVLRWAGTRRVTMWRPAPTREVLCLQMRAATTLDTKLSTPEREELQRSLKHNAYEPHTFRLKSKRGVYNGNIRVNHPIKDPKGAALCSGRRTNVSTTTQAATPMMLLPDTPRVSDDGLPAVTNGPAGACAWMCYHSTFEDPVRRTFAESSSAGRESLLKSKKRTPAPNVLPLERFMIRDHCSMLAFKADDGHPTDEMGPAYLKGPDIHTLWKQAPVGVVDPFHTWDDTTSPETQPILQKSDWRAYNAYANAHRQWDNQRQVAATLGQAIPYAEPSRVDKPLRQCPFRKVDLLRANKSTHGEGSTGFVGGGESRLDDVTRAHASAAARNEDLRRMSEVSMRTPDVAVPMYDSDCEDATMISPARNKKLLKTMTVVTAWRTVHTLKANPFSRTRPAPVGGTSTQSLNDDLWDDLSEEHQNLLLDGMGIASDRTAASLSEPSSEPVAGAIRPRSSDDAEQERSAQVQRTGTEGTQPEEQMEEDPTPAPAPAGSSRGDPEESSDDEQGEQMEVVPTPAPAPDFHEEGWW